MLNVAQSRLPLMLSSHSRVRRLPFGHNGGRQPQFPGPGYEFRQPTAERGFAPGKVDLAESGPGKGFHDREAILAPEVTFGQDIRLDVLEGCETEPAPHVEGFPQVVIY